MKCSAVQISSRCWQRRRRPCQEEAAAVQRKSRLNRSQPYSLKFSEGLFVAGTSTSIVCMSYQRNSLSIEVGVID